MSALPSPADLTDQVAKTLTNPGITRRAGASGFRLPHGLRNRFELVSMLPKQGSEAVLLKVRPVDGKASVQVLKLYARDLGLRTDVLNLLQGAAVDHVVELLGFGTEQGVGYELLDFVEGGDLEEYVRRVGLFDESAARHAVQEIARAIDCIHGLTDGELAHGDLKPSNILVRRTDPLDLVIADFGMATLEHDVRSQVLGTPRWSDPRAHSGYIQAEGDWWSLGALAYWLRTGRPVMDELSDAAVVNYLRERNVDLSRLPDDDELDWRRLCQGLLVREESERWGTEHVQEWLAGGSPPVGAQWDEAVPVVPAPESTHPITFGGHTYLELPEFAAALAADWEGSCSLIAQRPGDLAGVLTEHARETKDLDLSGDVATILALPGPAEVTFSRLLRRLSPEMRPVFRRWTIDAAGLAGLADQAAANPHSPEAGAVAALFDDHVLTAWGTAGDSAGVDQAWHDAVQQWHETVTAHASAPADDHGRQARARILLALLRPSEAAKLTKGARAAATSTAKRTDWFRALCRQTGQGPGLDFAVISLAQPAEAQEHEAAAARREAANRAAAQRNADSIVRVPRTRTILGRCLVAQGALVGLWLWLRVLAPHGWGGLQPSSALSWWADELPPRLANWVTWWTDPWVILPLFAVSSLLYLRARSGGPKGRIVRHRWERRAMQAAIAVTCLLVPPLIPVGMAVWWRGLQYYAPDDLKRRDPLRALCMGTGLATCTLLVGVVVGIAPFPGALPLTPEYQQWIGDDTAVTALAGPITAVGNIAGGLPPSSAGLAVTILVCVSGPLLVALAAQAYTRSSAPARRTMALVVLPGIIGVVSLPLAYLPQTWGAAAAGMAAVWVAAMPLSGRG